MINNIARPTEVDERTKNIEELEKLAAQIIRLKKSVLARRPIVIEFCGSPKAGKSSCINSLAMFLRRNEIRTTVISERGAICPIRNKFDPSFNIWAGCSGLVSLSEILANHSKYYDVVIMDRGFFDAICWFHWQKSLRKLHEKHYYRFIEFFLSPRWISKMSILYIFKTDPEVSLQREHAHLLTDKPGSIMNAEVLQNFNEAVDQCVKLHGVHYGNKIKQIDTSKKDQDKVSYEVTKDILETLNTMIVERVAYFEERLLRNVESAIFDADIIFRPLRQLRYGIRREIEQIAYAVQPVPVAVITDIESKRIVVAKKLRTATSEDSPERSRELIYFGGHIREEDEWSEYGSGRVEDVASAALSRELKEELDIDYDASLDKPEFCIWDSDNPHSAKHVALVYHVKIDRQSLRVTTDRKEFAEKGASVIDIGALAAKKSNFETWSRIIYERLFS